MNDNRIVIGIFENKIYAILARSELREAGIKANILRDDSDVFAPLMGRDEEVKLIVPDTQVEEAKKVLQKKFI